MSDHGISRPELITIFVKASLIGVISYFGLKWAIEAIDPTRKQKKDAQEKVVSIDLNSGHCSWKYNAGADIETLFDTQAERLLERIGIRDSSLALSEYELSIAAQLVDPDSIETTWEEIAGLDDVIEDMKATVILPLRSPEVFIRSELHQPPKGVLLHGPPGCGKTMVAKATAKEAGARFINLEVPALTDKWYGESQKLAAAVFTLALKLQPCIIFIDEIDSFLRSRSSHDHEATAMMKAQFMMLWDGLSSARHCQVCGRAFLIYLMISNWQVVVMGATNRPQDVDKAILRRMPAMFQIGLPSLKQRKEILKLILKREQLEQVDLSTIAEKTEMFSGSDLRELCRVAAMFRVRELGPRLYSEATLNTLRAINMTDFTNAVDKMKLSKVQSSGVFLEAEGLD